MDLGTILTNIERRLKSVGISSDEASRRAGRPDAIRNLKRKVEAGGARGSLRADTLAALATALETTVEDLTTPVRRVAAPATELRQYLLQQRALIDRQLAELDEAENTTPPPAKRKSR